MIKRSLLHPLRLTMAALLVVAIFAADGVDVSCQSADPPAHPLTDWLFQQDAEDVGTGEGWEQSGPDESWTPIEVGVPWEDAGYPSYDGVGWYATQVTVPAEFDGKWALVFNGVDDETIVFVNGTVVKHNMRWNNRFWVTSEEMGHLVDGDNFQLVLRVQDNGGGGGVWRPVELMAYDDEHELRVTPEHEKEIEHNTPEMADHIIYCIFVRNFTDEGTLAAAAKQMAHIRQLGATMVWVMPIQPIGEVERKGSLGSPYSIVDYKAVDPHLGTLDDARALVDAAHEHGMKIVLDLVANHTAWDSVWMESNPEWYTRDDEGNVVPPNDGWWDVADLNYDNPEVHDAMADVMSFWVEEIGFDGFRCDVAGMVPGEFWTPAIGALRERNPDLFMLAEWDGDPSIFFQGFNAAYDNGLHSVMISVVAEGTDADALVTHYEDKFWSEPVNVNLLRFTENHDQRRASEVLGHGAARVLDTLVFTMPGIPLIYNGREISSIRRIELFDREPINWDAHQPEYEEYMRTLSELRHRHEALRGPHFGKVSHDGGQGITAYWRGAQGRYGSARYIVVLNTDSRANEQLRFRNLAEELGGEQSDRTPIRFRDLITGRTVYEGPLANAAISIDGHEALVLHLSD